MKIGLKLTNRHFMSFAGNVAISLMSLIAIILLTRLLPVEIFGVWVFFQSVVILVDTLRSGFITTGFIKFYAGVDERRAADIEGSTWFIALSITIIITVINLLFYLLLPHFSNEGLRLVVNWFYLPFWVGLPYYMATCVLQAKQRFDWLLILRLISQGGFVLSIIILSLTGQLSLTTLIICFAGTFGLAGMYSFARKWISLKTLKYRTKNTISELYHFGKFTVGTTLSANLFRVTDTIIINFWLGPAALAIYSIGQRLMEFIEIPLRSFIATGMPDLAQAYNSAAKNDVVSVMKKYAGTLTLILIPVSIAVLFLADFAVLVIGGTKYVNTEAANVFRLFMTFALLYPAERFIALTLDVVHLPKINFIKVMIMVAANVIFDIVGVLLFHNVYGIALATIFPVIFGLGIGYWALNKYYASFGFFSIYRYGWASIKEFVRKKIIPVSGQ